MSPVRLRSSMLQIELCLRVKVVRSIMPVKPLTMLRSHAVSLMNTPNSAWKMSFLSYALLLGSNEPGRRGTVRLGWKLMNRELKTLSITHNSALEFFLNRAELSLNSANSGSLKITAALVRLNLKILFLHMSCWHCGSILVSHTRGG